MEELENFILVHAKKFTVSFFEYEILDIKSNMHFISIEQNYQKFKYFLFASLNFFKRNSFFNPIYPKTSKKKEKYKSFYIHLFILF